MGAGGWAMLVASWSAIGGLVGFCLWRVWRGPPLSGSDESPRK